MAWAIAGVNEAVMEEEVWMSRFSLDDEFGVVVNLTVEVFMR